MRYNDKNFKGCSLEIEAFMIDTNPDINEALKVLRKAFENSNSQYLPSRLRNVYELDNWRDKAKKIRADEEYVKKERERKTKELNKRFTGEFFEVVYKDTKSSTLGFNEAVDIRGVNYVFDTKKGYLKSEVTRAYEQIKNGSFDEFMEFLKENQLIYETGRILDKRYDCSKIFLSSHGEFGVKVETPHLRMYQRGKRNKADTFYFDTPLYWISGVGYYVMAHTDLTPTVKTKMGGQTAHIFVLKDYKWEGRKFIKK